MLDIDLQELYCTRQKIIAYIPASKSVCDIPITNIKENNNIMWADNT